MSLTCHAPGMNRAPNTEATHVTDPDLLTAGEAARELKVSSSYLARLARGGLISYEATPYGRTYRRAEIERLQRARTAGTAA